MSHREIAAPAIGLPLTQKERRGSRRFVTAFRRHKLAVAGLGIIVLLALTALFAPIVATHDPDRVDLFAASESPSFEHLLGTDEVGRDVFSRLVYGTRVSLSVGLVAVPEKQAGSPRPSRATKPRSRRFASVTTRGRATPRRARISATNPTAPQPNQTSVR